MSKRFHGRTAGQCSSKFGGIYVSISLCCYSQLPVTERASEYLPLGARSQFRILSSFAVTIDEVKSMPGWWFVFRYQKNVPGYKLSLVKIVQEYSQQMKRSTEKTCKCLFIILKGDDLKGLLSLISGSLHIHCEFAPPGDVGFYICEISIKVGFLYRDQRRSKEIG